MLLNLDETCIRFFHAPRVGMRVRCKSKGPKGVSHARNTTRGQMRKALTHVAVICNDTALQPSIPQVLLLAKKSASLKQLAGWQAMRGCSAEIWRCDSAWVNKPVFARIMARLGEWHRAMAPTRQPILLMDAHSVHCSREVAVAAKNAGIWLCIIPASTTSLLQPLDTDVFARYKLRLRTQLHRMMLADDNKDMGVQSILKALQESMKGVLQKNAWSSIFHKNGFGYQLYVRPSLLTALGWASQPYVSSELPSHQQFTRCFPGNREIPYRELLSSVVQGRHEVRTREVRTELHSVAEEEPVPWSARLRPRPRKSALVAPEGGEVGPVERETDVVLQPQGVPAVYDVVSGRKLSSVKPFPPSLKRRVSDMRLEACTETGHRSSAADS